MVDQSSPIPTGAPRRTGRSSPSSIGGRWNPTKEQIEILEELYTSGVRTPSANQIEEITVRLKAYGHIEGKNVFYWFQNHKARQRQKKKHQVAMINRMNSTNYHHPHPHLVPIQPQPVHVIPPPHVVYSQAAGYCTTGVPQHHHHHHHQMDGSRFYYPHHQEPPYSNSSVQNYTTCRMASNNFLTNYHRPHEHTTMTTLDLFPLHPTAEGSDRCLGSSFTSAEDDDRRTYSIDYSSAGGGYCGHGQEQQKKGCIDLFTGCLATN